MTPTPTPGNTEFSPSDTRSSERRTATLRRTGRPRGRTVPRGRWPSPARPRTARRAAISPAFCVRRAADDGQAAHGWPGQQRPIRPLAASLASSCPISSPWPAAAGGGSGRMSRPSGRRPSSCDQCGSTAATEPRRGRPQARWSTAMDSELGARGRAARAPGRSAGCRGARRRGTPPLLAHKHVRPCRVAHGCAGGWPASGGDDGALRQRPLGPSGPRRHRVLELCRLCSRVSVQ